MKFIKKNVKNIYGALLVFGIIIVVSLIGFMIYFNYAFQIFYVDNIRINHEKISDNLSYLEYQLQQAGFKILDDMDTAFLLYFAQTDNYSSIESAVKNMQYYKYCYDISSIQIVELNKNMLWRDSSMSPVPVNEYDAQNKEFAEHLKYINSGNRFIASKDSDNLTYIYKDYRNYVFLFQLSQKAYAAKVLTADEKINLNTWVYYKDNLMLYNNEKVDLLSNENLKNKFLNLSSNKPFLNNNGNLYIFSSDRNFKCISAVGYQNVLVNAFKTASFIWVMALILLSVCSLTAFFIVKKLRKITLSHVENLAFVKRNSETQEIERTLYKVLTNSHINKEDEEALLNFYESKNYTYYVPVIIMLDGSEESFHQKHRENIYIYTMEIREIAHKAFLEIGHAFSSDAMEKNIMFFISTNYPEKIMECLNKIRDGIRLKFELSVSFVICSTYSDIKEFFGNISNEMQLMNYHFILGYDQIIDGSMLKNVDFTSTYPLEIQRRLVDAVSEQNYALAGRLLNDFEKYTAQNGLNIAEEWILTLFINVMRKINIKENQYITFKEIKALTQSDNLEQSLSVLREYLLSSISDENSDENKNRFIEAVERYTKEYYSDPNYDLTLLQKSLM